MARAWYKNVKESVIMSFREMNLRNGIALAAINEAPESLWHILVANQSPVIKAWFGLMTLMSLGLLAFQG